MNVKSYSGKFVLRIPPELHRIIYKKSEKLGVSLNSFCTAKLQDNISAVSPHLPNDVQILFQEWGEDLLGVLMFGSVARGDQTAKSDLDLLIVLNNNIQLSRKLYRIWDAKFSKMFNKNLQMEVNPHFVHIPSNTFEAGGLWYELSIDGILLWEKYYLVSKFLKEIRENILNGNIKRFMSHGHQYWVKYEK